MATGYEDIDKVMQQQNTLLQQQEAKQNEIVDLGLQKTQAQVEKQKAEYQQEAEKSGKQLYTDYRKASNPYGANAENLASQGLNKSGYAESTQTQLYNAYQKNATTLMTETQKLKADADFQMNQAMIDADVQKAQNALVIYQQKAQLALQEYEMKFSREQFDWQKQQAERQWQYQTERDAISDQRWQKEYELSLKKAKGTSSNIDYSSLLGGVPTTEEPQLSEGAQKVLNAILNTSESTNALTNGLTKGKGLTEQGAKDMLDVALNRKEIDIDEYKMLKAELGL